MITMDQIMMGCSEKWYNKWYEEGYTECKEHCFWIKPGEDKCPKCEGYKNAEDNIEE